MQNRKEIEKRLDRLCSFYVRNKEKKCYTCGRMLRYADRQAGHFVPRIVQATRWDLSNVHVQCAKCNVEKDGNLEQYRNKLFGRDRVGLVGLEKIYDAYKHGKLKNLDDTTIARLYNFFLDASRREFPKRAVSFSKWEKIGGTTVQEIFLHDFLKTL